MALIGEAVVEEWLNRQGYFTIRGLKLGHHEIDILAVKPNTRGTPECRHIEVQVSANPVSYISDVPKGKQKTGTRPNSAKKRTQAELRQGIKEWIEKKFDHPDKNELRMSLCCGKWTRELVVNAVRHPEELELLSKEGVKITYLTTVLQELRQNAMLISGANGKDLLELMMLGNGNI